MWWKSSRLDRIEATLFQLVNRKWQEYSEIDGKASYRLSQAVDHQYRGTLYRFSDIYDVYDWQKDQGYKNFSRWVN